MWMHMCTKAAGIFFLCYFLLKMALVPRGVSWNTMPSCGLLLGATRLTVHFWIWRNGLAQWWTEVSGVQLRISFNQAHVSRTFLRTLHGQHAEMNWDEMTFTLVHVCRRSAAVWSRGVDGKTQGNYILYVLLAVAKLNVKWFILCLGPHGRH